MFFMNFSMKDRDFEGSGRLGSPQEIEGLKGNIEFLIYPAGCKALDAKRLDRRASTGSTSLGKRFHVRARKAKKGYGGQISFPLPELVTEHGPQHYPPPPNPSKSRFFIEKIMKNMGFYPQGAQIKRLITLGLNPTFFFFSDLFDVFLTGPRSAKNFRSRNVDDLLTDYYVHLRSNVVSILSFYS